MLLGSGDRWRSSLRWSVSALLGVGMQVGRNPCQPVRPGPVPIFTERIVVKIRADQAEALQRIARVLGQSVSDVTRWFIDNGIQAVEGTSAYQQLEELPHDH